MEHPGTQHLVSDGSSRNPPDPSKDIHHSLRLSTPSVVDCVLFPLARSCVSISAGLAQQIGGSRALIRDVENE